MFTQEQNNQSNAPELITTLSGHKLLKEPFCRQAIENLSALVPLSKSDFEQFYIATIARFAETIQSLPATRYAYYANPFGLLQLGLDRANIAIRLALKTIEDVEGRKADQLTALDQAELFAIFSAALLSDLGSLPLRFSIKVLSKDKLLKTYDPYAGTTLEQGSSFGFDFLQPELSAWPAPGSLILANRLLSTTAKNYQDSAFAWLSQHQDILQFWYNLMLQLSPAQEESTRRRYLYALIPNADHDLIEKFLDQHFPYRGLPPDKKKTLFSQNDDTENPYDLSLAEDDQEKSQDNEDRIESQREAASYERVFGGGLTDATNARTLGSVATLYAPHLRQGLAFLGWLMTLAKTGQLAAMGAQANFIYNAGGDRVVLDWQKAAQAFAKEQAGQGKTAMNANDLLKGLRESQLFKTENLQTRQFSLSNNQGTASFSGILLPAQLIFGDQPLPHISLGLVEMVQGLLMPFEAAKETFKARFDAIFTNKPKL